MSDEDDQPISGYAPITLTPDERAQALSWYTRLPASTATPEDIRLADRLQGQ